MMLGRQRGPRVPARAPDTPHLQAGERRKPSLSSGMCSCFPSGLQSCARAPLALALPLAECCAVAGLCPRRWGLTGYVFSTPPSGFSPSPSSPGAHARTLLRFRSYPTCKYGRSAVPSDPSGPAALPAPPALPAPAGGAGSRHRVRWSHFGGFVSLPR